MIELLLSLWFIELPLERETVQYMQPLGPLHYRLAIKTQNRLLFEWVHIHTTQFPYNQIDPTLLAQGEQLNIYFEAEEVQTADVDSSFCNARFEYPQVSGLADLTVQNQLNQALKREMLRNDRGPRLQSLSRNCKPVNIGSPEERARWTGDTRIYTNCDVKLAKDQLLSFLCRSFVEPGASPVVYENPATVNLRTGRLVALQDLFRAESNLSKVLRYAALSHWFDQGGQRVEPQIFTLVVTGSGGGFDRYDNYYLHLDFCGRDFDTSAIMLDYGVCITFPGWGDQHRVLPTIPTHRLERFEAYLRPDGPLQLR